MSDRNSTMVRLHDEMSTRQVFERLNKQRNTGLFCDIQIRVEEKVFSAHKNILVASSVYFESMFTHDFLEKNASEITLRDISKTGMEAVMDFIYTRRFIINEKNFSDILYAASLLQMNDMLHHCGQHIIRRWQTNDMEMLIFYIQLADRYFLQLALGHLESECARQFRSYNYSKSLFYLDIPKESFCRILNNPIFRACHEFDVYKIAKKWLQHEPERMKYSAEVMGAIRFMLIPKHLLQIQIAEDPLIKRHSNLVNDVSVAIDYLSKVYTQPMYEGKLNEPRGESKIFCISPALTITNVYTCPDLGLYTTLSIDESGQDFDYNPWQEDAQLFHTFPPMVDNTLVMIKYGHFLFILGVDKNILSNVMYRYHPCSKTCIQLHSLPGPPLGGAAVARTDKYIVVVGGMEVNRETEREDFERDYSNATCEAFAYRIADNDWRKLPLLPMPVVNAAACELNGTIYMAGGRSPEADEVISKVWAYNFISKSWIEKCSMTYTRADFILEAVNGNLYAVGTWTEESDTDIQIEMYQPQPNQWTRINMNTLVYICGARSFVHENKIYILGGDNEEDDYRDGIIAVDILNRYVESVDFKLPQQVFGQVCAVVKC